MALACGAKLHLDKYEESVAWLHSYPKQQKCFDRTFFLAAGLAQLSRLEEARAAIKTGLALNPLLDGKLARFGPFKYFIHKSGRAARHLSEAWPVRDQPAILDKFSILIWSEPWAAGRWPVSSASSVLPPKVSMQSPMPGRRDRP